MRLTEILLGGVLFLPLPQGAGVLDRQAHPAWKTYTSMEWRVALDYPADWSVESDGERVTFRSNGGVTIQLGRAGTETPSEPAPGRRAAPPQCTTTTTAYDVAATVCFEPISLARRAVLVLKAGDGRQRRLALQTHGRDSEIFDAMVVSVRGVSPATSASKSLARAWPRTAPARRSRSSVRTRPPAAG